MGIVGASLGLTVGLWWAAVFSPIRVPLVWVLALVASAVSFRLRALSVPKPWPMAPAVVAASLVFLIVTASGVAPAGLVTLLNWLVWLALAVAVLTELAASRAIVVSSLKRRVRVGVLLYFVLLPVAVVVPLATPHIVTWHLWLGDYEGRAMDALESYESGAEQDDDMYVLESDVGQRVVGFELASGILSRHGAVYVPYGFEPDGWFIRLDDPINDLQFHYCSHLRGPWWWCTLY
ncbi:MAG: hypothetical protein AAGA37_19675 [Actinomycetota bacterium]